MIGHASTFHGAMWEFADRAEQGLYSTRAVYGSDLSMRSFTPWLDVLVDIQWPVLEELFGLIPREWVAHDEAELLSLLKDLYARRVRVPELVRSSVVHLRGEVKRQTAPGSRPHDS